MSGALRRLPEEQLREFKMAFACFDLDGNGEINQTEMKAMLERLGEYGYDGEVQDMIDLVDDQGNGAISFAEFAAVMANKLENMSEEEMRGTFDLFDKDHDGGIIPEEMLDIAERVLGANGRFTQPEVDELMQYIELDQDGTVDYPGEWPSAGLVRPAGAQRFAFDFIQPHLVEFVRLMVGERALERERTYGTRR